MLKREAVIEVSGVKVEVLSCIINFIYTGDLRFPSYQLSEVCKLCTVFGLQSGMELLNGFTKSSNPVSMKEIQDDSQSKMIDVSINGCSIIKSEEISPSPKKQNSIEGASSCVTNKDISTHCRSISENDRSSDDNTPNSSTNVDISTKFSTFFDKIELQHISDSTSVGKDRQTMTGVSEKIVNRCFFS